MSTCFDDDGRRLLDWLDRVLYLDGKIMSRAYQHNLYTFDIYRPFLFFSFFFFGNRL